MLPALGHLSWDVMSPGTRRFETSAVAALAPVLTLAPVCLAALFVFWLPVRLFWHVSYPMFALAYLAAGSLLFLRPVQVPVLTRLLGARRPTRAESVRLDTAWRSVLEAARMPSKRYVLAVLGSDELNAFACGGHLVVITSLAVETLPRDELAGVLAHELSHHLGFHTVALTATQWLSAPVLLLARVGFFLQNVATAATSSFASNSPLLTVLGRLASALLTAVSWVFLSGIIVAKAIGNWAGRGAEFQADERVIALGFGRELASALRRVVAQGGGSRPIGWRDRLSATHPPARTRIARIEALMRRVVGGGRGVG